MITLKVKTIWQNQVAMRDKYWSKVKLSNEDLQFVYTGGDSRYAGQVMTIPYSEISDRVNKRAIRSVADKFSEDSHVLLYFAWRPDGLKSEPVVLPEARKPEPEVSKEDNKQLQLL